jgi:hypothetical protein
LKIPEQGIKVNKPHSGTEPEQLLAFLNTRKKGIDKSLAALPVKEVLSHFGWSMTRLLKVAQEAGYLIQGDWLTLKYLPLGIDAPIAQAQVEVALRDKKEHLVTKYSKGEEKIIQTVPKDEPSDIQCPIDVQWFPGAADYICRLSERLAEQGHQISSPKRMFEILRNLKLKDRFSGKHFFLAPHAENKWREIVEPGGSLDTPTRKCATMFYIDHVDDKEQVLHMQPLFVIESLLYSVNSARASVLLYETLVGPYLPAQPSPAKETGADMAEKLLSAIQRVKTSEAPTFAMGPIQPPPEFRDWYESDRTTQKFNTYRIVASQRELTDEELLPHIARAARRLEAKHEDGSPPLYPLEVVIAQEDGLPQVIVLPAGSLRKDSKMEIFSPDSLPITSVHERKQQRQNQPQHHERTEEPAEVQPIDFPAQKRKKRSTGTRSSQRKKKWRASRARGKVPADTAGGRPNSPRDAGPERTTALPAPDRRRPSPVHREPGRFQGQRSGDIRPVRPPAPPQAQPRGRSLAKNSV